MFGMNIKRRRRRKKIRVQYKKCSFYTTKPLSESFFAEQKRENGAAGKFFLKVQTWEALNYFSFSFLSAVRACPSAPTQCLLPPWWRALAALQEARFPRRLQSHAPYCIIIYSVVREVKGTRPKEAGWRLFLFIMAWYRTPGQSASYSQPHGARPDPPDFFP